LSASAGRFALIDAVKGLACTLIVWHHMSIYGPMGQGARSLWPAFFDWLAQDGRLAVQVFLALAGFLAAASLAPQGLLVAERPWKRIALRYARLAMPYLMALSCAVLAAALVRPWLDAELVPAAPTLAQLFAHGLLLQDLLGHEALSAGVWYVAIDFQLYTLALVLLSIGALPRRDAGVGDQRARRLAVVLVLAAAAVSLLVFNRYAGLDATALYFFGAYGLGMLSWWIGQATLAGTWGIGVAALALLGAGALWLDWRSRIAIALVTALALAVAQRRRWLSAGAWAGRGAAALLGIGRIAYSLFLIHFPVILLVSGVFAHLGPVPPWVGALGMLATFGLSLAAAALLYRWVETRPASWGALLALFATLLLCGAIASLH
jgi:peptidoglycan/LPS O-acetylase OafA/YrhL